MVAITRKVGDLTRQLRQALEEAVGRPLRDEQQVMIQVGEQDDSLRSFVPLQNGGADQSLPDWCSVYDGLSEEELTALDSTVGRRADFGRSVE